MVLPPQYDPLHPPCGLDRTISRVAPFAQTDTSRSVEAELAVADVFDTDVRRTVVRPRRHEWWTRRAAFGLGAMCATTGGIILANASVLQTPIGAALLFAYQSSRAPRGELHGPSSTLRDWAMAEALSVGVQAGGITLIATGFILVVCAVR